MAFTGRTIMLTEAMAHPTFDERFDALLEEGRAHHAAERLETAREVFSEAHRYAESVGARRAADRAYVNVCTLALDLDRTLDAESFQKLREILMAGEDLVTCWLASYNLARAYEFEKEHRKGLFYARIALDRSRVLEARSWLASSHNQIGNFLLAESRFEEALQEYRAALSLLDGDGRSVRTAAIFDNLGYTFVMLGREREGLRLLYRSLRDLQALGYRREKILPHLSLCFALLEIGRYRLALRHGARALALAEETNETDSIKHALFLIGEAAQQSGDPSAARESFEHLQRRYFPDAAHLPEMLLAVDVRKLVNLKA
jgi:tetratricopeptide (TPR) repeat protein